jgi:phosphoenolpyruvate carboxylase
LHFAKLFRIDHLVEISPLFETEEALLRGDAIIEEALKSRHFGEYVTRLGRLCIQFGYSDSGRYIGQSAAAFLIERLRLKLAAVLARQGLPEVQVVLFNTHGESMGRGGHPASLTDRLRYLAPDASRAAFTANEIAVKEESSFQGGDGYLFFLTPELAFASVCRVAEASLKPPAETSADPIYASPTVAGEFFEVVRQEFSRLVADPDYSNLLGAFGRNLTDNSGSRPVVRQHEYRSGVNEINEEPCNAEPCSAQIIDQTEWSIHRGTGERPPRHSARGGCRRIPARDGGAQLRAGAVHARQRAGLRPARLGLA